MASKVAAVTAARSGLAALRFSTVFEYETDCADVHDAIATGQQDFVLFDVRSPERYAKGHITGAVNLANGKLVDVKLREFPLDTLFVVYSAGPHCHGAHRAALGRQVKLMAGGVTGWLDEGYALATGDPGALDTSPVQPAPNESVLHEAG